MPERQPRGTGLPLFEAAAAEEGPHALAIFLASSAEHRGTSRMPSSSKGKRSESSRELLDMDGDEELLLLPLLPLLLDEEEVGIAPTME